MTHKRQLNRLIIECTDKEKNFILEAAKQGTYTGALRHWVMPVILSAAENVLERVLPYEELKKEELKEDSK